MSAWDRFLSTGASDPLELADDELAWVATGSHAGGEDELQAGRAWLKRVKEVEK